MSKVRAFKQNELRVEFTFKEEQSSLLNALQKQQVDVLYHCKEGFCGACRCKLKSGEVEYINDPLAFVRRGEILTCCSKPKGDIEIELL